jgi:transcription antitermination factor NusA-like protein
MVAVGRNGENVKQLSEVLRRKIRIVAEPVENGDKIQALKRFISDVVAPVEFTSLEMNSDGVLVLSGERESKAMLIGRDRSKEKELAEVLERNFGVKEFKIM